jgi:microcystin degradation protein MlrC
MRIAVAGFQHESNTFADAITTRDRFVEDGLLFGSEVVERWRDAHHEIAGFLEAGVELGFETLPLLMTKATPSGPVDAAFVNEIAEEIVERLRQSHADGLLLALHGAMVTTAESSGDTVVLRRLRAAVGASFPIVVTLDFHANCTAEMAQLANAILCYQTNPHTDMRAKGLEAGQLMHRLVDGGIRPVCALRKPPMIVPINHQATERMPLKALLAAARAIEQESGMLSASVVAGFPYADVPAMGPAILAISDGDATAAAAAADRLADLLWASRPQLVIDLPDAGAAVSEALRTPQGPVVLVDFGDNVGGGSPADGTFLLQELVRQQASQSGVVVADPAAVEQCVAAGVRNSARLSVGGKTDRRHGNPVVIDGVVRGIHDGRWIEPQARHGGVRFHDQGLSAVVGWGDENQICLTSRRYPPFSLGQLTSMGVDPSRQRILVVKAAIAYRAAYEPIAARIIEVDTPGLTAVNPRHFVYRNICRPIWPLDESFGGDRCPEDCL